MYATSVIHAMYAYMHAYIHTYTSVIHAMYAMRVCRMRVCRMRVCRMVRSPIHAYLHTCMHAYIHTCIFRYATRVQEGAISLPSDKCHLLNAITGCEDLDEPPAVNHDRYHHLNMLHVKRAVHSAIGTALAGGSEERVKILKVLELSTIDQLDLSFLCGDAPAPYVTDRLMADFFTSIPDSLWRLNLAYPLPSLPTDMPSYSNLRRIRALDLSGSIHLTSLPCWLKELPQLDSLLLRNCRSLRHLTSDLHMHMHMHMHIHIYHSSAT